MYTRRSSRQSGSSPVWHLEEYCSKRRSKLRFVCLCLRSEVVGMYWAESLSLLPFVGNCLRSFTPICAIYRLALPRMVHVILFRAHGEYRRGHAKCTVQKSNMVIIVSFSLSPSLSIYTSIYPSLRMSRRWSCHHGPQEKRCYEGSAREECRQEDSCAPGTGVTT